MLVQFTSRAGAVAITAGLGVFGTALAFHPPLVNPWAVEHGLGEIARHGAWEAIHWAGAAGLFLWLTGLLALHRLLAGRGAAGLSPFAAAAAVGAMVVWLLVMALEAGAMPGLARSYVAAAEGTGEAGAVGEAGAAAAARVLLIAAPWYTFGLLLGYAAAGLHWIAVALWGVDVIRWGGWPRWFGWWGALAGGAGAVALPVAVALPKAAVPLLAATSGPAGAWTLVAAWFLWREG